MWLLRPRLLSVTYCAPTLPCASREQAHKTGSTGFDKARLPSPTPMRSGRPPEQVAIADFHREGRARGRRACVLLPSSSSFGTSFPWHVLFCTSSSFAVHHCRWSSCRPIRGSGGGQKVLHCIRERGAGETYRSITRWIRSPGDSVCSGNVPRPKVEIAVKIDLAQSTTPPDLRSSTRRVGRVMIHTCFGKEGLVGSISSLSAFVKNG